MNCGYMLYTLCDAANFKVNCCRDTETYMSSVYTSSLSESSDFVEYSQAQSSTVSLGEHEEMKRKVYMRKKDRKPSSFSCVDDKQESSDSDSSTTNSTKSTVYSLKSCESSYDYNSALSSEVSSPVPSDSNSSHGSKSSNCLSNSSNLSSDEIEIQY